MRRLSDNHRERSPGRGVARRGGFSAFEMTVAVLLLASVFATLGPMLTWIRQQRRRAEERQLAVLELANAAERLSLLPYERMTSQPSPSLQLSPEAEQALSEAQLTAEVNDETDPSAKRVTLQLAWREDGVRESAPLRLVIWRFPEAEVSP